MTRDLEHLELVRWREPLTRRKQGGGGEQARRDDFQEHGRALDRQIEKLTESFEARLARREEGLNPKLIFRLRLKSGFRELADDDVRKLGLGLLGRSANGVLVVFPDNASVQELRRRIQEYSGIALDGHSYSELDAIEGVEELGREDRLGRRLTAAPLLAGEVAALDIELWHGGDKVECRAWIREVRAILERFQLHVTDDYVGSSLCLLRARVSRDALDALLDPQIDYIKEIERRPKPSFEMGTLVQLNASELASQLQIRPEGLVGIIVVDSGVATSHPLLREIIGDAQTAPNTGSGDLAGDVDETTGGHGTAVAGIAAYHDLAECMARAEFIPRAEIFSARVTDASNEYDPELLVEHQLSDLLEYFISTYPSIHVVNISLGNADNVFDNERHQFRFAATIDELAYRFRDREILFVVSSGNIPYDAASGETLIQEYPSRLLEAEARLIDPATAALALTVGGLSYGEANRIELGSGERTDRLVAGERGWPSPFTRTGLGVGGSIKPDVVDFGGDIRVESGRAGQAPQYAGIPTTNKSFAPPDGRLLRTVAGTSFAAPRVANLAGRLFQEFPGISSNLVRCLVASSARLPVSRPPALSELDPADEKILRTYGYGQPDFARARWSAENDALLVAEGTVEVDSFELFELPTLPSTFFSADGSGELAVSLAFDPPTRHTRFDSYLGIAMEAHLYRNASPEQVADAIRDYTREEKEAIAQATNVELRKVTLPSRTSLRTPGAGPSNIDLSPGINLRMKGTLQRGICRISSSRWQYDGGPLILAVICRRVWAPVEIVSQRFAAVVSISHESEAVRIHEHVRAQLRVRQRARV